MLGETGADFGVSLLLRRLRHAGNSFQFCFDFDSFTVVFQLLAGNLLEQSGLGNSFPREGNFPDHIFWKQLKDLSCRSWNCHLHCITWGATPTVQLCLQLQKEIEQFLTELPQPEPGFEPGTSGVTVLHATN